MCKCLNDKTELLELRTGLKEHKVMALLVDTVWSVLSKLLLSFSVPSEKLKIRVCIPRFIKIALSVSRVRFCHSMSKIYH